MDQSLLGEQVQIRVKKLELVGTETIMMHHWLLELIEQATKTDQNWVQLGKHFDWKEQLEMAKKYDWIELMQRQVIQGYTDKLKIQEGLEVKANLNQGSQ